MAAADARVVLTEVRDSVAVVTLNRPEARNALSSETLKALRDALRDANDDGGARAVVLTGADPAFCAGLDLKELGSTASNLSSNDDTAPVGSPWAPLTKPLIGAVNGPAITGGLELALHCDFLVASERARFADTHARVGVMPGWGLTVLLPQAIGLRRAKEMSVTGNFLDAAEALRLGLVNHVVPHAEVVDTAVALGRDIAGNDTDGVRTLLASYKETARTTLAEGVDIEQRVSAEWRHTHFDSAEVERRRAAI
ncbi:MAG: enoyl-CoA hydratase, partial [Acidimicrobiaceae bacterium]|nr:enoyl-CoA hydratase [Acidimicrobiaceae bacterium]